MKETSKKRQYADALLQAATACGWTQAELAEQAGVSRFVVNNASIGRTTPAPHRARKLTEAVINQINVLIRRKSAEIARLQQYGETLKRAYKDSYESEEARTC